MEDERVKNILRNGNDGEHYDTKITPRALLELGFTEEYQSDEYSEPGFIYYNYRVMGLDLTSVETLDSDFRVLFGEGEYPIRNLQQVSKLITVLEEVKEMRDEK